ncbi:MAG: ADP-ribosyl-[dinitrogen reductase] hydrolase, partial [Planctomycetes bacterium]|nr:ADP-ribosyl-[dinitrogen reductase] hydrolase [Planctomycetota bacterium]
MGRDNAVADLGDKFRGVLVGLATGDALGAPLEFMSATEISRQHGTVRDMRGGGWLRLKPGEYTDDTEMAI